MTQPMVNAMVTESPKGDVRTVMPSNVEGRVQKMKAPAADQELQVR